MQMFQVVPNFNSIGKKPFSNVSPRLADSLLNVLSKVHLFPFQFLSNMTKCSDVTLPQKLHVLYSFPVIHKDHQKHQIWTISLTWASDVLWVEDLSKRSRVCSQMKRSKQAAFRYFNIEACTTVRVPVWILTPNFHNWSLKKILQNQRTDYDFGAKLPWGECREIKRYLKRYLIDKAVKPWLE